MSQDENGESINNVEKTLNSMGVSIRSSKNEFLDFNNVLVNTSNKWNTLNGVQKNEIATVLGGRKFLPRYMVTYK